MKVIKIDRSLGIVLPKELLAKLDIKNGDMLYVTEASGGILLTACRAGFVAKIEAGKRVIRKHRRLLRKLAD